MTFFAACGRLALPRGLRLLPPPCKGRWSPNTRGHARTRHAIFPRLQPKAHATAIFPLPKLPLRWRLTHFVCHLNERTRSGRLDSCVA